MDVDLDATDRSSALTPPSGDGDLGLVDSLAQLTFAVQGHLGRIAAANDMSVVQARLLGILRDRSPSINELAAFLQLDKSSVTGLVDRAQARGLVTRTPSAVDRRSVQVTITRAGRRLIDRAVADFDDEIERLTAELTPRQRSQLSAAATRIVLADARRRRAEQLSG